MKKLKGSIVAFGIFFLYLAIGLLVPAYATKLIFVHGPWVAKFLIYLLVMYSIVKAMNDYKIHKTIAKWYKKKFGTAII